MFSFEEIKNQDNKYRVLFDGNLVNEAVAQKRNSVREGRQFNVYAENRIVGEKLIPLLEKDFSQIDSFIVNSWNKWGDFDVVLMINEYPREISCLFRLNLSQGWNETFSFEEYFIEFSRLQGEMHFAINTNYQSGNAEIELDFSVESPLLDKIHQAEQLVLKYHNYAVGILTNNSLDSVKSIFRFPDEVKASCEQYLLYFAQFLRDLGINATPNLKEEAGKVLFSVTPTDDIEALDKIREALAIYLSLPSSPIVYDESFKAMRLQQQIENLQHFQKMAEREKQLAEKVLMIQSETIREKNIVISQKDLIIEQQNKVIEKITSKSIMIDSLENKEELEEIFEGLQIGKSKFLMEQLGVHLNPATALKTAGKKILGKEDENKSILGLDEETN